MKTLGDTLMDGEYWGRLIVIGASPTGIRMVGYAVTGRSPSSQARRLVRGENGVISTEVTDQKLLETGIPELLIYDAIVPQGDTIYVSNGAQTQLLASVGQDDPDQAIGKFTLSRPYHHGEKDGKPIDITSFEPDAPNSTPRISGVSTEKDVLQDHLHLVKSDGGTPKDHQWSGFSYPGKGKFLATYTGVNANPLPSWEGDVVKVAFPFARPEELTDVLDAAIHPDVKVACAAVDSAGNYSIINARD